MARPRYLNNRLLHVGQVSGEQAEQLGARLLAVAGVEEAVVVAEEGVAYLKVDPSTLEANALDEFSVAEA